MGWAQATVQYYQALVKQGVGEMLIIHADVNRVLHAVAKADQQGLARYLARLIERLAVAGAEVAQSLLLRLICAFRSWKGYPFSR